MSKLTTYLLQGSHEAILDAIPERHHAKIVKWQRACVVTDQPVPKSVVVEAHPGDHFESLSRRWVEHSRLDDLHNEYVRAAPVPARKSRSAIARWLAARSDQDRHEKLRLKALDREYQASEDLVRTHGRAPLVLEGMVFDPMLHHNGTTVFYRSRRGEKAKAEK